MDSYTRFRFHQRLRKLVHGSKKFHINTKQFSGRYLLRRTPNLKEVQRFVLGWLVIVGFGAVGLWLGFRQLNSSYLIAGPKPGGAIVEGVVGEITNMNPIFLEGNANDIASRLVFNGLVGYDQKLNLVGDLAESWQIDEAGKTYTFKLRPGIKWHDGGEFTAKDVLFTFTTIQNTSVRSPLNSSWRDVSISTPDDRTVVFTLPTPYAPFLHSLTTGILPEHLLGTAQADQVRKLQFNQQPVGTGPFKFKELGLAGDEVRLVANEQYFKGRPKLDTYTVKTFKDPASLQKAYISHQINLASGFKPGDMPELQNITVKDINNIQLANEVLVFFNTQRPLVVEKPLRQALSQAIDTKEIVSSQNHTVEPAYGPLLPEHLGFKVELVQIGFDKDKAKATLDQAGWAVSDNGIRKRGDQFLKFGLVAPDDDVYPEVTAILQRQLREVGVQLDVKLVELNELQQSYIRPRNYDMVISEINIGADPDVHAFWHSSQVADPGLNLSQYNSGAADEALGTGRTRQQGAVRAAKYEAFLGIWRDDAPAVALFRPDFIYLAPDNLLGINIRHLGLPHDRFYNVQDWTVYTQPVLQRLNPELVDRQKLESD